MSENAIAIADIVGIDLEPGAETPFADALLASLTHMTNARPFFALLDLEKGTLAWTSGGAEFGDIFCAEKGSYCGPIINSCKNLFVAFGMSEDDMMSILLQMDDLEPGTHFSSNKFLQGENEKYFRISARRRKKPFDYEVQVTIYDVTPFKKASERVHLLAQKLVSDLNAPIETGESAAEWLSSVLEDVERLFLLENDDEIAALTSEVSERVTSVSNRMVELLQGIENQHENSHWQPVDGKQKIRPIISVHEDPVESWDQLQSNVLTCVDGRLGIVADIVDSLTRAYNFVKNSENIFIFSPEPDEIMVLNGKNEGKVFSSISDFISGIGVEANSMQTARDFFEGLKEKPSLATFSVDGKIVHAWGRPGAYGGWQSSIINNVSATIDVRGMFHGIKNLMLHLQIVYVIKNKNDVDEIRQSLGDSVKSISNRFNEINEIASTGERKTHIRKEKVIQWIDRAKLAAHAAGGKINTNVDPDISNISFNVAPFEMEDAIEELVLNAFHNGSTLVNLSAKIDGNHLVISVLDDGNGIKPDKLSQLRASLNTNNHDPNLSTRIDGTGNGLLSVQGAVRRFVDGALIVDNAAGGRGTVVSISMKLPDSLEGNIQANF